MNVQLVIGFYAVISLMMIVFNLSYLQWEKIRGWRLARRTARLTVALQDEIAKNLDFPTEEHCRWLERRLRSLAGMESFDRTMERVARQDAAVSERYLSGIAPVFERAVTHFSRREALKRAYVAALAKRWYRVRPASPSVIEALQSDLLLEALYARQNAFEALVALGSSDDIARATIALGGAGVAHSRRLVSETLLAYPGDADELADALLARFEELSDSMKVCAINYLRLSGAGRCGRDPAAPDDRYAFVKRLMNDEEAEKDVRLACVRFFMRNRWSPALESLIRMARDDDATHWEYAAVATLALSSYPQPLSVRTLKHCLRSPVYQVRFNAAKSLYDLGLTLEGDLAGVMAGSDRYAREMLLYRWRLEQGPSHGEAVTATSASAPTSAPTQGGAS